MMNTRGSWNAARIPPLYDFFTGRQSHTRLDLYIKILLIYINRLTK